MVKDYQQRAHPACERRFRDVKVGNDCATVNDWAGAGKRFGTCPTTGCEVLNSRNKPTTWVTVDNRASTLLGSGLCDEQMGLHKSCGHTDATAEKETRQQKSFYCLPHLDGQIFSRGKGGAQNGVCEGAVTRADALVPPEPA
jgi:hypothetical protein